MPPRKPRSTEVHARCGRPWSEHRLVDNGVFLAPRCDDEPDQLDAAPPEVT